MAVAAGPALPGGGAKYHAAVYLSPQEQWFAIMINLPNFAERPAWLGERYDPLLKRARSKGLTSVEQTQYLRAMVSDKEIDKVARAYLRRGREEGREEGRELGRREESLRIVQKLQALDYPVEEIARITGLSSEEIEKP